MIRTLLGAALFAAIGSSTARAEDALANVSQAWATAWQARNLEAVIALYSDDAVFDDESGARIAGKKAIRRFFAKVLKQYRAEPRMTSTGNASAGDLAYDSGTYSEVITPIGQPKGAIETHGAYLVVLKRVGGKWLIAEQTWTGSAPVPVKQ